MHNYANVSTINQLQSPPSFRVGVMSLDGINGRSIQTGENDSKQSDEIHARGTSAFSLLF